MNGKWFAIGITIILAVVGVVLAIGSRSHEVDDNTEFRKGPGAANTEHRIRFEEKVDNMQTDVTEIRTEQITMKKEILDAIAQRNETP